MTPSRPTSNTDAPAPAPSSGRIINLRGLLSGPRFWIGSLALLVALYAGRGLLEERRSQGQQPQDTSVAITYDAYSNGVTTTLYDIDGNIEYTLEAEEQIHYLDNTTHLTNPNVRLYPGSGSQWNIVARSGRILAAEQSDRIVQLDLSDEVELFQNDDTGNVMTLATSFLSLFPNTETMQTNREVLMTTNTLRQTAIGMHADLQQDTLTFLTQVKGRYEVQSSQP
jgi:LPS export ABC transporter protein LptC